MAFRGAGDRHQVDLAGQFGMAGEGGRAKFFGHGGTAFGIGIDHADQFDVGQGGVFLGMEAPEVADADDGGTKWSRHGG